MTSNESMESMGVWESHLPVRLGVSRDQVRELRKEFAAGSDWWESGRRVVWSADGVKKLAARLLARGAGASEEAGGGSEEDHNAKKAAGGGAEALGEAVLRTAARPPGPVVWLVVHQVFRWNLFLIQCMDGGRIVRCRTTVRSDRLRRGQRFPAVGVEQDLFQMVGKPNWKGEWPEV